MSHVCVITGSSNPIIHLHMTPLALQGPVSALLVLIRNRYVQSLRNLSNYCSWHERLFRTTYSALYGRKPGYSLMSLYIIIL